MNLQIILDQLEKLGRIKASRLATIKMSARRYAESLGCRSLEECAEEIFAIGKLARNQKIEENLGTGKSHHTIRNTKSDVSFLLRQAQALNLIKLISESSSSLKKKSLGRRKISPKLPPLVPYEKTGFDKEAYSLPLKKWDKELRLQYDEWLEWVTTPNNKIGNIDPFNRPATIETKTSKMEAFFGFLRNVKGISELDFEMMIDVADRQIKQANRDFTKYREERDKSLLQEFIAWHMSRYDGKYTAQAGAVISVALSLAEKFYLLKAVDAKNIKLIEEYTFVTHKIKELRSTLAKSARTPKLTISKHEKMLNKEDLWRAAIQEFPSDTKLISLQAGTIKASNAARAVAIMLLLKHPLRSGNLREAKIGRNIFKNSEGKWIIRFDENEESVERSYRKRQNNFESFNYEISFEIAEYLEKYIEKWHQKLVNKIRYTTQGTDISQTQPSEAYLFLTSEGLPFPRQSFSKWIGRGVFRWFGVRVNPDLIRQISK